MVTLDEISKQNINNKVICTKRSNQMTITKVLDTFKETDHRENQQQCPEDAV
jgi:hypothetical protein